MKTKLNILLLALLTTAAVINTASATDTTISPNGFKSPECTFGADTLTSWLGWNLKFSQNYGRDAKTWPTLLLNAAATTNPQEGDLMALDGWDTNPSGHVAWVYGRQGYWVLVLHTNMRVGTDYFTYANAVFRYTWVYYYPGWNSVYFGDNGKWYPLKTFLTKK